MPMRWITCGGGGGGVLLEGCNVNGG